MKQNGKKSWRIAAVVLCVISIFTIGSCQIGLGASVDTAAPTLSIEYPPASAVIKGWFTFSGKWDDDKGVTKVDVTVLNTETTESWTYSATVDTATKTWAVEKMNPEDSTTAYGYTFPDGKYEISAVASDAASHTSGVSSRSFEIDNTAPLFILSSPGTDEIANATAYGASFKITGTIADEHSIKTLDVSVYNESGTLINTSPYEFTNVNTAGGTTVKVAVHSTSGTDSTTENKRYTELYGSNSGTVSYSCKITLADAAKQYQNPSETANTTAGNTTSTFYLNDDVYSYLLSTAAITTSNSYNLTTGLGLDAGEIRKIINGTESYDNAALVKQILKDNESTAAAFSLNPDASPKYNVTGLKFNTLADSGDNAIGGNSGGGSYNITVVATAGRDGTFVKPGTLKVYQFGPYETLSAVPSGTALADLYDEPATYATANPSISNILGENTTYSSSTVETYTYPVQLSQTIVSSQYYLLAVTGKDADNIDITPSDGYYYGFKGSSASNPPTLTWNSASPDDLSIVGTSSQTIVGNALSSSGTISKVLWSATVHDESKNNDIIGTIDGEKTGLSTSSYDWSFALAEGTETITDTDYTTCFATTEGKQYLYDVTVWAFDNSNAQSAKIERRIHVDTQKPTVVITSVSPTVPKTVTDSNNNTTTTTYVNGKIKVSGAITETNLSSVSYAVYINDNATASATGSLGAVYSFTQSIDTTGTTDIKNINVVVTAIDKAGNKGTYDTTTFNGASLVIDQTTDNPIIEFSNADDGIDSVTAIKTAYAANKDLTNLFGITSNNKLNMTITDDDGVSSIVIKSKTSGSSGDYGTELVSKTGISTTTKPITTYPLTLTLPATEGAYDLQVTVKDMDGTSQIYNKSIDLLTVAVDAGAPVFSNVKLSNTYCSSTSTLAVTGVATDSSGVWLKAVHGEGASTYTAEASVTSGSQWTDTLSTKPTTEGSHTIKYTATDAYGQSATTTVTYIYDTNAPSFVNDVTNKFAVGGKSYTTSNWYNDTSLSFTGYYNEAATGSGISKIYYWQNKTPANTTTPDVSTATNASSAISPNASNGEACKFNVTIDGFMQNSSENYIYFAAVDGVGNVSKASGPFAVNVDNTPPTISPASTETVLTNSKSEVTFTGVVSDTGTASGVNTTTGAITATKGSISYTSGTTYTLTLSTEVLGAMSDGINVINATVKDNAGNSYTGNIATVNIDKTNPTASFTYPAANATVNKTITLTGTAADTAGFNYATLSIATYDTATSSWGNYSLLLYNTNGTDNASNMSNDTSGKLAVSDNSWSYKLDTTKYYNSTATQNIKIKVTAYDEAGNTIDVERVFTIDQNADRPVINITNISANAGVLKYGTKAQLNGTISDDDASDSAVVKTFIASGVQITSESEISNKTGTTTFTASTGDWIYEPSDTGDGEKTVYFYIVDNGGQIFYAGSNNTLEEPKIKFKGGTAENNSTKITYKSDSQSPVVKSGSIYYGTSGSLSTDATAIGTRLYIGGTSRNTIKFYILANDANGIAGMTLSATDSTGSTICTYATTTGSIAGNSISSSYTAYGTFSGTTSADSDAEWTTGEISLTGKASGAMSIIVYAYDTSGLYNNATYTCMIDNAKPTVSITSPGHTDSDYVASTTTIKGTASDETGSGISSIQYLFPTTTQVSNSSSITASDWTTLSSKASVEIALDWDHVHTYSTGADYPHSATATSGVVNVPVYFLITDEVGNSSLDISNYILVDTDASKPTAKIIYPVDGGKVGSTVYIYGSATDDISVKEVWVQLDVNGDGKFDSTDSSAINGWSLYDSSTLITSDSKSDWHILATGTNSWKLAFDSTKITKSLNTDMKLGIRVRALDGDGNIRDWSSVSPYSITVTIDQGVPTFSEFKVVQYASDGSTVNVEREYTSGMYISAKDTNATWYLTGTITDDTALASYSFVSQSTASIAVNGSTIGISTSSNVKSVTFKQQLTTATTTSGKIYTQLTAVDDEGKPSSQYIVINVDSTAPALYTTGGVATTSTTAALRLSDGNSKVLGSANTIYNSDGSFTFGDTVVEADSGLAYLAFAFDRIPSTGSTTSERVYCPMYSSSNNTVLSGSSGTDGAVYINSDKLPVMYISGTRSSTTTITSTKIESNSNVRVGGLIKIAGAYNLITAVDSTSGIVTFNSPVSITYTTAELVYAQVVNHSGTESTDASTHVVTTDSDDGDGMWEKLTTSAESYIWKASFFSTNITDGKIRVYVTAIDNAGNVNNGYIDTFIQNNRPRFTKAFLATDLSGNSTYDYAATTDATPSAGSEYGEFSYYPTTDMTNGVSVATLASSSFIVKSGLLVVPEFVGGNSPFKYVLTHNTSATAVDSAQQKVSNATTTVGGMLTDMTTDTSSLVTGITSGSAVSVTSYGAMALTTDQLIALCTADSGDGSKDTEMLQFSIWDSTEEATQGTDSQWAVINVPLTIDVVDATAPVASINPFHWTSLTDNSIYGSSAASKFSDLKGHIELESDLDTTNTFTATHASGGEYDNDPKVSGLITITGSAYDETRLASIGMSITGISLNGETVGSTTTLATYSTTNGNWTLANSSAAVDGTSPTAANNGWKFQVLTNKLNQSGHTITWQLDLDTSKVTVGSTKMYALKDMVVLVTAVDAHPNTSATSTTNTTTTSLTPYYRMDVVPYITSISTGLSGLYASAPSVFSRTALGHYGVRESEQITIAGFNISTDSTTKAVVTLNGTTLAAGTGTVGLSWNVGTIATSGSLVVTQNSMASLNNSNTNPTVGATAAETLGGRYGYNSQANGVNNNLLMDDVVMDVYQFTTVATPKNGIILDPYMRVNPKTGQPGFCFDNSVMYFNMPGYRWGQTTTADDTAMYSQVPFGCNYGGFTNNTFTWDNNGESYGAALCPDTGNVAQTANFSLFYRRSAKNWWNCENYYNDAWQSRLENTSISLTKVGSSTASDYTTDVGRIITPALAASYYNNVTNVYVVYFDRMTQQLRFRWGTIDANNAVTGGSLVDYNYSTGAQDAQNTYCPDSIDVDGSSFTNGVSKTGTGNKRIELVAAKSIGTGRTVYQTTTTYGPGQYADIGVLNIGTASPSPVIAWYDATNRQLMISWETPSSQSNTATITDTSTGNSTVASLGDWTTHAKVVDSEAGSGLYVKMAIDSNNGIHLAYYSNLSGDLKYAYVSGADLLNGTLTKTVQTVDSYLSVGAKCTIEVTRVADSNTTGGYDYVPYIGYQMNSNLQTTASARVAHPVKFNTANGIAAGNGTSNDYFIGNWEISTVPTTNTPIDAKVSAGIWTNPTTKVKAAIPKLTYVSKSESATYAVGNSTIVGGNGTLNPVVSYAVSEDGALEMAQQK